MKAVYFITAALRMNRVIPLLILIGALLAPTAGAGFVDGREWSAYAVSFIDADGVVSATSFTLNSAPHGFTVNSRTTSVQWTAQLTTTPASAGQIDQYGMTLIIKEGATTRITCDGVSFSRLAIPDLGRFQSTFLSFCQSTGANALVPGTTYTYETTVTMVSGTNKIVQSGQSFKIQQTDSITDTSLEPRFVYTNALINATKEHVDGAWSRVNTTCQKTTTADCEGLKTTLSQISTRLNTTCQKTPSNDGCESFTPGNFTGNVTINETQLEAVFLNVILAQMNPIALVMNDFFWLLAIVALAAWAEYGRSWLAYLLVTLGLLLAAVNLSTSFWLRLIIIGAGLVAMVRTLAIREQTNTEDDNE